jgi:hypothetical protein
MKNKNMTTKKVNPKRYLTLLAGFLVFYASFAQQQNFLGFKGDKAEMQHVELKYFKNGKPAIDPDTLIFIGGYDTYRLQQLGFDKLTYYIYESLRFAKNQFMVSNASMPEQPLNVNLIERQNGGKWGKITLSHEFVEPIDAAFNYDGQNKILLLEYSITDWDNIKYIEERDRKIDAGLAHELGEYEKTATPGMYIVSVIYLIK